MNARVQPLSAPVLPLDPGTAPHRGSLYSALAPRSLRVPWLYSRSICARVGLKLVVVLAIIEGIFLAEKFVYFLDIALEFRVHWANSLLLLGYYIPDVFDLALPISLLAVTYWVLLGCRETRELVAIAATGVGPKHFVALLVGLGIVGQIASLLVTGTIEPYARFLSRQQLFESQHQALRRGVTAARFYHFPKYVVFSGERANPSTEHPIFIFQNLDRDSARIITSQSATLEGPDADNQLKLRMRRSVILDHSWALSPETKSETAKARVSVMRVGSFVPETDIDGLVRFAKRGEMPSEKSTMEIVTDHAVFEGDMVEFARRLARSSSAFIAPMLAGLALCLTRRGAHVVTLPLFCAVLMAFDIAASTIVKIGAPGSIPGTVAAVFVATTALEAVIACAMLRLQAGLFSPRTACS